jgi:chaperonin cofactor prefoldin
MKKLSKRAQHAFNDITTIRVELDGLYKQQSEYSRALVEVGKIINDYKKSSTRSMMMIVGGNLVRRLSHKETIDALEYRKKQTEIALNSVEEQIKHREDNLQENFIRVFYEIKRIVPKEMFDDEDNEN